MIGADKKPITVRGTKLVPMRIGKKKTDLRRVAVENFSMKLIIGFPGLRDLGLSMDLKTQSVKWKENWQINEILK